MVSVGIRSAIGKLIQVGLVAALTTSVGCANGDGDAMANTLVVAEAGSQPEGGFLSHAATTFDAGWLFRLGVFGGSTRGESNTSTSRAALSNTVLFGAESDGLLSDVLADDGPGKNMLFDLRELLGGNGPGGDLVRQIFGDEGPLAGGIKLDLLEEDAQGSCGPDGVAHAEASVKLLNVGVSGKTYTLKTDPNQTIWAVPGARIVTNVQDTHAEGPSAKIRAAALAIEFLGGRANVEFSHTTARAVCADGENSR